MQSSPNMQGYKLPTNPDPPLICVQLKIPNDPAHIQAFLGALYDLTLWNSWQRDSAHTGRVAAQIWKKIWLQLVSKPFGCEQQGTAGAESEETLIRQNPDNPCELQTSINGVDWCTFADLSKCIPAPSQPGGGTAQPPPDGGNACYKGQLEASSKWLLPTVVNTGDVLELDNPTGATWDGSFDPWRCPDGSQFFAGLCGGPSYTDPGDPLNTVSHMRLIWNIAGTYYDAMAGPVTVGGGVSNAVVTLQVNDSTLSDNAGNVQFSVCVTNNQSTGWFSTFDFQLQSYAALLNVVNGTWHAGIGYVGTNQGSLDQSSIALTTLPTSVDITQMGMIYDCASHSGPHNVIAFYSGAGGYLGTPSNPIDGTDENFGQVINANTNQPGLQIGSGSSAGPVIVKKFTLNGPGVKPAGWP